MNELTDQNLKRGMMKNQDRLLMTLPADPAYASIAAKGAEVFSLKQGVEEKMCGQIALAIEEAVLNALEMEYGGMENEVEIHISSTSKGIKAIIQSRGLPLDPENLPQYSGVGGLGLILAASFSRSHGSDRYMQ